MNYLKQNKFIDINSTMKKKIKIFIVFLLIVYNII